ncbi:MAG: ABC transporter ATP-binding protein, partial [Treponema sp.]|nr:ABC transporter ATP-binding protein [Treponema sp.]
ALLCMLLKPMNLLILDEPTNHLDLHSKDILLDSLRQFTGTIIFVSHDRAFMEALSTKTLELSPGADQNSPARARLFYGNYGYYLDKVNGEANNVNNTNNIIIDNAINKNSVEQRQYNKQRQAQERRRERQEVELLNAIETLEKEKSRLETELSNPEVYSNGEKAKAVKLKLDECAAAIAQKTAEWEALTAELV